MRRFSKLIGVTLLAGALNLCFFPGARSGAKPLPDTVAPDHIVLSWTADPRTSQTITWRTGVKAAGTVVEFWAADQTGASLRKGKRVIGAAAPYKSNLGTMLIHSATIRGLAPGETYCYRVGDGQTWGRIFRFTTEPGRNDKFTFVAFGDSQSPIGNYRLWSETIHAAYKREKPRFLINVGDLVDNGQDQRHWESWFQAASGVLENIPEMPVPGNHETYRSGPVRKAGKPEAYLSQFSLPDNGPPGLKEQAYSFDWGQVHFVMLDSQAEEEGDWIVPAEKTWLEQDLRKTNKPWKVVVFHKPPFSGWPGGTGYACAGFEPILEKFGVDLVLNGHHHVVMRIRRGFNHTGPDSGPTYLITGRSGTKVYPDNKPRKSASFFYNPVDQPGYVAVTATGEALSVVVKKLDGKVVERFELRKGAP